MPRICCVYILTNTWNTVLYTGVTSDLLRRVAQHRARMDSGCFTGRYQVWKLVYWEVAEDPMHAIRREKQLKAGSRARKVALVKAMNPEWDDLAIGLGFARRRP